MQRNDGKWMENLRDQIEKNTDREIEREGHRSLAAG